MRDMIVSELSQAMHELARGFAHFLPRLIVMLVLAFVGWVIAYIAKILLRSILRLIKFDRLSDNAGASQLLTKAALPSSTELLSRFHSARGKRARDPGLAGADREVLSFSATTVRGSVHHVLRAAGS